MMQGRMTGVDAANMRYTVEVSAAAHEAALLYWRPPATKHACTVS